MTREPNIENHEEQPMAAPNHSIAAAGQSCDAAPKPPLADSN